MANANDKRLSVRNMYKTILGRNKYSKSLRGYAFKKYSDGKYYSDCSSSISLSYKEAGFPFPTNSNPNTVGMYQAPELKKVDVTIKNGIIQNPSNLRIGDMLLFAGTDSNRAYADCVGHVEMVYAISGSAVTLAGHGSGTPRTIEMNTYCKSRYSSKTSTKIANKGLLKVVRYIQDDGSEGTTSGSTSTSTSNSTVVRILKKGMTGSDVKTMQNDLIKAGYSVGPDGADGDFGANTEKAVKTFQKANGLDADGEYGPLSRAAMVKMLSVNRTVQIVGGQCWVRSTPSTTGTQLGIAKEGERFMYGGQTSADGWLLVQYGSKTGWVSGKYGKLVS